MHRGAHENNLSSLGSVSSNLLNCKCEGLEGNVTPRSTLVHKVVDSKCWVNIEFKFEEEVLELLALFFLQQILSQSASTFITWGKASVSALRLQPKPIKYVRALSIALGGICAEASRKHGRGQIERHSLYATGE